MAIKTEDAFDEEELLSTEDAFSEEPTATEPEPKQNPLGAALTEAGNALSWPARALGTLRKDPDTGKNFDINNQQSNLFRPEINKVKSAIDQTPTMSDEDMVDNAIMTGSMPAWNSSTNKEIAKGLTEFVGTSVGDPLSYVGPAAKIGGKGLKELGVNIESSVLGKGNKSILKKNKLTTENAAETALEENVGGSLKGTISKVTDKLDDVENDIQSMLSDAVKNDPNAKVNVDDIIDAVKLRIESGAQKDMFGQTDEALNALESFRKEVQRYGYSGEQTVDKANEIKRIFAKKGFKKGSAPTPDTQAKEQVADIINLALKDNIEQIVPAIKEKNAVYKTLIPIRQMAENRLPTAQSNDLFSLGNILTTGGGLAAGLASQNFDLSDPKALLYGLGAGLAYRATKSGNVAQSSYNLGKLLEKTPTLPYGAPSRMSNKKEEPYAK